MTTNYRANARTETAQKRPLSTQKRSDRPAKGYLCQLRQQEQSPPTPRGWAAETLTPPPTATRLGRQLGVCVPGITHSPLLTGK